jgi:hypothetical protein
MVLKKKESLLSLGVHILFGAMLVFFEAEMWKFGVHISFRMWEVEVDSSISFKQGQTNTTQIKP